jgi:hypothetical protein
MCGIEFLVDVEPVTDGEPAEDRNNQEQSCDGEIDVKQKVEDFPELEM